MLDIFAAHTDINNLEFSTDPNPQKSKTKCIAFSRVPKTDLAPIFLNGDILPWVDRVVHVGNTLFCNGKMEQDIKEKRAMYIERCMELNQEFMACPTQVKCIDFITVTSLVVRYGTSRLHISTCCATAGM